MSGVTYDKSKNTFRTCTNVDAAEFETATTFQECMCVSLSAVRMTRRGSDFQFSAILPGIRSFNVSTNQWAAKYIFKRLRFLGSKFLSHFFTLIYLALWHGWRSGYYVTFTMEFLIMKMEWEVRTAARHCIAECGSRSSVSAAVGVRRLTDGPTEGRDLMVLR